MRMQFQTVFDSMCRCFGHEDDLEPGVHSNSNQSSSQGIHETSSQISAKKRTNRLELKDKQWDELFEKTSKSGKSPNASPSNNADLGFATATTTTTTAAGLAQSKPTHPRSSKHKTRRKKPTEARDEIFRMKAKEDANGTSSAGGFARLWNPYMALCFATPVRGPSEEPEEPDVASETATLNTNEDTITSTVYFENKYKHIKETRPPMPLFNQFKIGNEKDEIRNIMNSDSHSSVNMIRLLQQQQQQQADAKQDKDDEVPGVKAVSTSTDSSSRDSTKPVPHQKLVAKR